MNYDKNDSSLKGNRKPQLKFVPGWNPQFPHVLKKYLDYSVWEIFFGPEHILL